MPSIAKSLTHGNPGGGVMAWGAGKRESREATLGGLHRIHPSRRRRYTDLKIGEKKRGSVWHTSASWRPCAHARGLAGARNKEKQ